MADLWYVRVRKDGRVCKAFCDDIEKPMEGDIPLDPVWYWGRAPGIRISDPLHGLRYTVANGRLVPTYDASAEISSARQKKEAWVDEYEGSPILSPEKKRKMPEADYEAYNHIATAINDNEIEHTRKCGY